MQLSTAANQVAVEYLSTAMPKATLMHIAILRCCIIDALAKGITDDTFIEDVGENPIYSRSAKQIFKTVGGDILDLIEKTQEAASGSAS